MGPFHHLDQILGTLTDLVNTSPQIEGVERLGDVEAITAFARARSVTEIGPPTEADIAPLHRIRRRFLAVFTTENEAARISMINELLASASIEPRLVEHDSWGLHFHFFAPYASLSEHLNADCAMALAVMVASGETSRLRVCARPGCNRVMVDSSRNRSRAYCDSRTCGNKVHASAYRDRQRAENSTTQRAERPIPPPRAQVGR
jgi:predicted RNA-binding Zn ribbon-like protein